MANPTSNYGFVMPQNTDLVKDLPADFDIFGQAVDDRIKALNPETTAGDISYRGGTANAKTRLGIGTAGQVLTVNAGATAPEWKNAASAINLTLANAGGTALTGAGTITVSGLTSANFIQVWVWGASTTTGTNKDCILRINTDSGTNYEYIGIKTNAAAHAHESFVANNTGTDIPLFTFGADATALGYAVIDIDGGASTGRKVFASNGRSADGWGGEFVWTLQGAYKGSSAISSVSLITTSGNFDAGTIYVYTSA